MKTEEMLMIQRVSRLLGESELHVMRTPFVELIEKLCDKVEIQQSKIESVVTYLEGYKK